MRQFFYFVQLARVGMAPLTMSAPILGAFSGEHEPESLFGLAVVGLCAHFFGFGLNALIDAPLDRSLFPNHPLYTGKLSVRWAWIFTLLQIPLAFGIYSRVAGQTTGFVFLAVSLLGSIIYNLWSKWGVIPKLAVEICLAASVGLLCAAGMNGISPQGVIFAVTLGLTLLRLNSVPSGLKDIRTDAAYGARSFALATGTLEDTAGRLHIPTRLKIYSAILQLFIWGGMGWLIGLMRPPLAIGILSLILMVYAALHLRMLLLVPTFDALRRSKPLLSGYYHYAALMLVLWDELPALFRALVMMMIVLLLLTPVRMGWRLWRRRYQLIEVG